MVDNQMQQIIAAIITLSDSVIFSTSSDSDLDNTQQPLSINTLRLMQLDEEDKNDFPDQDERFKQFS